MFSYQAGVTGGLGEVSEMPKILKEDRRDGHANAVSIPNAID